MIREQPGHSPATPFLSPKRKRSGFTNDRVYLPKTAAHLRPGRSRQIIDTVAWTHKFNVSLSRISALLAAVVSSVSAAVFQFARPDDPLHDSRLWVVFFAALWPIVLAPLTFLILVILSLLEKNRRILQRSVTIGICTIALVLPWAPFVVATKPWLSPEEALLDLSPSVRVYGAERLAGQARPPAIKILVAALQDPIDLVRWDATRALKERGADAEIAVPALIQALRDSDLLVSSTAAEALGRIPSAAAIAVPPLVEAMAKDQTTRCSAAEALGRLGPAAMAAIPVLVGALHDDNRVVRGNAARALGRMGAPAELVAPQLRSLLRDDFESVREAAIGALLALGVSESVPVSASRKWPKESFSPDAWRRASPDGRYIFYKDVVGRRLLEYHTGANIIALFGQPDFKERQVLTYILKYSSKPGAAQFDALWKLEISIDNQGRARPPVLRAD